MAWLDDYLGGAHVSTWAAMTTTAPRVRDDPEAAGGIKAVVDETMRRVRADLEALHRMLAAAGYEFARPSEALVDPAPDAAKRLDIAEAMIGPIPSSLRGWIEHVGRVDFTGRHPAWDLHYTDAIVVDVSTDRLIEEFDDRRAMHWFEEKRTDRFPFPIAPDYIHKADESGGPPYSIWLPDPGVDAPWEGDDLHEGASFVGYLRSAILDWAGFPGWGRVQPGESTPRGLDARLRERSTRLVRF